MLILLFVPLVLCLQAIERTPCCVERSVCSKLRDLGKLVADEIADASFENTPETELKTAHKARCDGRPKDSFEHCLKYNAAVEKMSEALKNVDLAFLRAADTAIQKDAEECYAQMKREYTGQGLAQCDPVFSQNFKFSVSQDAVSDAASAVGTRVETHKARAAQELVYSPHKMSSAPNLTLVKAIDGVQDLVEAGHASNRVSLYDFIREVTGKKSTVYPRGRLSETYARIWSRKKDQRHEDAKSIAVYEKHLNTSINNLAQTVEKELVPPSMRDQVYYQTYVSYLKGSVERLVLWKKNLDERHYMFEHFRYLTKKMTECSGRNEPSGCVYISNEIAFAIREAEIFEVGIIQSVYLLHDIIASTDLWKKVVLSDRNKANVRTALQRIEAFKKEVARLIDIQKFVLSPDNKSYLVPYTEAAYKCKRASQKDYPWCARALNEVL